MVALAAKGRSPWGWQLWLWLFASLLLFGSSYNVAKFAPLKRHWVEGRSKKRVQAEFRNWVLNNPALHQQHTKLPDLTLYLSGHTTRQVTANPIAHALQTALDYKGISYARQVVLPGQTPLWLVDDHGGKLPCMQLQQKVLFDPYEIASTLDEHFGGKSISRSKEGDPHEVLEKTKGLLPALTLFLFDIFPEQRKEVFNRFVSELDILEGILRQQYQGVGVGAYLCGREPSIADFVLAPQLYHMEVGLRHFKGFQISAAARGVLDTEQVSQDMAAQHHRLLKMYMIRSFRRPGFMPKDGKYEVDHVVSEWKQRRAEARQAANISEPVSIPYSNVPRPKHLTGKQMHFVE